MSYPYYNPAQMGQQPNGQAGQPAVAQQQMQQQSPPQYPSGYQQGQPPIPGYMPPPTVPQQQMQNPQPPVSYGAPVPPSQSQQQQIPQPPGYAQQQTPVPQGQQQAPSASPLDGVVPNVPGVPREWVGRPWSQVVGAWNRLMSERMQQAQQTPQQSQQQMQQPQQMQSPQQQQQRVDPNAQFYQQPAEALRQIVREELAPVRATSIQQEIERVRGEMRTRVPMFAQLESQVMSYLAQAGFVDEQLVSPAVWENALKLVLGDMAYRQQLGRGPQQMVPQQQYGFQQQPQQQHVVTPHGAFFTEGATPQGLQQQGQQMDANPAMLTDVQRQFAQRTGMPYDAYAAASAALRRGEFPNV